MPHAGPMGLFSGDPACAFCGSPAVLGFRAHGELGLTLDQLADVADAQRAPRVVQEGLRAAAAVMRPVSERDPIRGDDTGTAVAAAPSNG